MTGAGAGVGVNGTRGISGSGGAGFGSNHFFGSAHSFSLSQQSGSLHEQLIEPRVSRNDPSTSACFSSVVMALLLSESCQGSAWNRHQVAIRVRARSASVDQSLTYRVARAFPCSSDELSDEMASVVEATLSMPSVRTQTRGRGGFDGFAVHGSRHDQSCRVCARIASISRRF